MVKSVIETYEYGSIFLKGYNCLLALLINLPAIVEVTLLAVKVCHCDTIGRS